MRLMATRDDVTGPVNLGNPGEFTMRELAELIIAMTGSRSQLAFLPLPATIRSSGSRISRWRSRNSTGHPGQLREGLQRTIEYFRPIVAAEAARDRRARARRRLQSVCRFSLKRWRSWRQTSGGGHRRRTFPLFGREISKDPARCRPARDSTEPLRIQSEAPALSQPAPAGDGISPARFANFGHARAANADVAEFRLRHVVRAVDIAQIDRRLLHDAFEPLEIERTEFLPLGCDHQRIGFFRRW